jgi:hypothetical protein
VAERLPDRPDEAHPVVAGLLALIGVGLVVGLILGAVAVAGTKVIGLGGGSDPDAGGDEASLYLPSPEKTTDSGPEITLAPQPSGSESLQTESPRPSRSPEREITLSADTTEVGSMQPFQLTGIYPRGEGAILTVQRFEGGGWQEFPATGSVSGKTCQIPVQSSRVGVNRFRVVDTDTGLESGEVRVTIVG